MQSNVNGMHLKGLVRSGGHPEGPSCHGCCSDVLPPFSVSNQLLESNSVSPCGNAIQRQTSSFQILFYIVHLPLLWASNRWFSCWFPNSNFELWMATSLCSSLCSLRYIHTISLSFSEQYSLLIPALSLPAPPHCLLYPGVL